MCAPTTGRVAWMTGLDLSDSIVFLLSERSMTLGQINVLRCELVIGSNRPPSTVSFTQLAAEHPVDDRGVDRDDRRYEYSRSPEQEGERLVGSCSIADSDRV